MQLKQGEISSSRKQERAEVPFSPPIIAVAYLKYGITAEYVECRLTVHQDRIVQTATPGNDILTISDVLRQTIFEFPLKKMEIVLPAWV